MKNAVSIIIPVYKEAHTISHTLAHLSHLIVDDGVEIIVVDGCPRHSTLRCISEPGIRKIASKKGRGVQMNKGASAATGDILLFLHADTIVPVNAIRCIQNACRDIKVAAGAFSLGIQSSNRAYRIIEKAVYLRTKITQVPYGDQAIFVKRSEFIAIGGYRDIPIMEDVDIMKRMKEKGVKIAIIQHPVQTSPRRWEREGIIYGTLRNWMIITLYYLGVSPFRLARFYHSERLPEGRGAGTVNGPIEDEDM